MKQALSSSKPKEVWCIIHLILKPNQKPLRSDPDRLNKFFAETVERTFPGENQKKDCLSDLIAQLPSDTESAFQLKEVSYGEVVKVLKSLRTDTSTGPDNIPVKFAKMVHEIIASPLTSISINCIRKSYFPKAWKMARISPIPKVDSFVLDEHFRPISILPALSKVFEKLVAKQMSSFCEANAVLAKTLSSFRKGHSTSTVLMGMRDDLIKAMKKGGVTLMVLADFSKAFDTIDFKTLILKLSSLGFSTGFLRWLSSYLTDRSHFVQIDDKVSELETVRFGVPQGSILGPMLFNLYVSDLKEHLPPSVASYQYADDTTILTSCRPAELAPTASKMNNTLDSLSTWSSHSHLALNSQKTKVLLVSTSQMSRVHSLDKNQPAISVLDRNLEYVTTSKILGVCFHKHLSWNEHIISLCKACYGTLSILRKIAFRRL